MPGIVRIDSSGNVVKRFEGVSFSQAHGMCQDRDGNFLGGVAPRRYACLACHVPQTTAQPLVDNLFTDMDALAEPERRSR